MNGKVRAWSAAPLVRLNAMSWRLFAVSLCVLSLAVGVLVMQIWSLPLHRELAGNRARLAALEQQWARAQAAVDALRVRQADAATRLPAALPGDPGAAIYARLQADPTVQLMSLEARGTAGSGERSVTVELAGNYGAIRQWLLDSAEAHPGLRWQALDLRVERHPELRATVTVAAPREVQP